MKNVMWFKELSRASLAEAGGKGANLGEMLRNGFPIPNGYVVTSGSYLKHLEANNLIDPITKILGNLDVDDNDALMAASEKIKEMIIQGSVPKDVEEEIIRSYKELNEMAGRQCYVAVRSSATAEDLPTASFAGQQSTFLNVFGGENVVAAVKECWASLFEPRAIYYRVENKFEHMKVRLAAVVQMMVQSEKAGVVFTVDPLYQDPDILSIETAYGLGEVVVSGQVTPDTYRIDKKEFGIIDKSVAKQTWMLIKIDGKNKKVDIKEEAQQKQKLSDLEIKDLAKICKRIEEHYSYPQDIEYAFEKGNLYIVQSRPITTLTDKSGLEKGTGGELVKQKEKGEKMQAPKETKIQGMGQAKILVRGLGSSPGIGMGKVRIVKSAKEIKNIQRGDILVTEMTTPDFVPGMKKSAAIITDTGGMTSHAAIVSRELGVPCVVGTGNATTVLKDDMEISVDGSHGIVYEGFVSAPETAKDNAGTTAHVTGSVPVTGTKIYVNMADVDQAEKIANLPADGVGLLRAEFMVAGMGQHPRKMLEDGRKKEFVDKLADDLRRFAAAFYPRPVVYRATDFKTNEYRNLEGGEKYEPHEENPMMGYRGAARYIQEPELFKMELEAIKKVREEYNLPNLWLMIPFVRRIGELRAIKDMMTEVKLYRTRDFKLWIMVEVPSTVVLIDLFCKEGIDGISIGTNDLTQLTLGIDRDNATLAKGFDERNEAVLRSLKRVVTICNKYGVTSSLCGQAPSVYPEFAEKLVEFGITSMSVNPDAVERTRRIVASAEQKIMLRRLSALSKGDKDKDDSAIQYEDE
ncbi:putative phosphoenolpyruvate synthase [Candidatus Bilamarchaeum dharawalense]|uniref:Phosphoenolpyruvate synthase n=1 Tax=Candidatus Bilamarchaeum dharawalense TaxID=2885759 RepID=A0A5E4LPW6_9ARCH|nr:putative phosphoenolpyruvate synthase [Candidatus Bilamarchaeum dharawalense]